MRRWQDRGEVLDSDEEEDSLEASPQRPAKRVRLGYGIAGPSQQLPAPEAAKGANFEDHASGVEKKTAATKHEDEDEDWLQPKPAITYGKRPAILNNHTAGDDVTNSASLDALSGDADSAKSPASSYRRAMSPKDKQEHAYGQVKIQRRDDTVSSSQPSNDSDDLPDVHDLLARRSTNQGIQPRPLSLPSSPLSERDVSPSPPPLADMFRFSTPPLTSRPTVPLASRALTDMSDREAENAGFTDVLPELLVFAGPRNKRNLRTRNEKQLHPYMFDKAQYLQQCRQRGMRPVRLMEAEQTAETQNESPSENEDQSSQVVYGNGSSSPGRNSSPAGHTRLRTNIGDHQNTNTGSGASVRSDDDLPDLAAPARRPVLGGVQEGSKRRRLFSTGRLRATKTTHPDLSSNRDDFSIPPSPPPTSSEQNERSQTEDAPPKFRYPRGFTPKHSLPTPRVSSNIRPDGNDGTSAASDEDWPRRRSGLPTSSRKPVADSSSSESSDPEEEEPALDERHLIRERKRIKGVLPASWLKIDFRAQQKPQQSPSKLRIQRADSSSPERISPQKGVAQRIISKRSGSPHRAPIEISDDDSDARPPSRGSSPSPPRIRQSRLDFEARPQNTATPSFVDVDDMEGDWIDPMFAGSSRKGNPRPSKKRQPKIVDAFKSAPKRTNDVLEDRNGPRRTTGVAGTRHRSTTKSRKPRQQRSKAPRLSILDAPEADHVPQFRQPQFVRLAMRQARKQRNNARESPSDKHVRLATRDDTEDATSVLREWREGTIQPRQLLHTEKHGEQGDISRQIWKPLANLSSNTLRRNPFELQGKTSELNVRHITTVPRPRLQQTRLHAEVLEQRQPSPESNEAQDAEAEATTTKQQKLRQIRPQPSRARLRGAQLESLESEFDQAHRTAAFERKMHLLTESVARRTKGANAVQLERFLYGSTPAPLTEGQAMDVDTGTRSNLEILGPKQVLPHRNRKRLARRIDAESREYRQPSEPLPEIVDVDQLPGDANSEPAETLQGLGPFGTRYATDFDIAPLAVGTYFHQTSFVGSGDFAAALNFAGRDLDKATGRITIHVDGDVLEWGAWTEEVASGLAKIPRAVADALGALQIENQEARSETATLVMSNVDYFLRSVTRYFSRCLAFLDPVDRQSCTQRIHGFVEDIFEVLDENSSLLATNDSIKPRSLQFAFVIAKQALELSTHRSVGGDSAIQSRKLVNRAAHRLADAVFPRALAGLRTFYDENRHTSKREAGIRDDNIAATSVVILYHVLNDRSAPPSTFWAVIHQQLNVNTSALDSVSHFDRVWYDVFTILPMLEMDATGIAQVGSRLQEAQEDWTLVRRLFERLFSLYDASSLLSGSTINDYVRSTLTRCYRLVSRWGWWKCDSLLGIIFDFFARRGLAQLHKEDSRASPRFLELLKDAPSLEVQPGDGSFHIFLKLLASSLIGMRQHGVYTDKKIGGIAWRFIPNHGRTYRKDAEVKQQDLDALRNHHDLLCTLYYASPSRHRLRLDLLRNLVDHSVSHREACRLSVRAWANLAAFQISTNECDDELKPLIEWYREVLTETMTQYRLAKQEVERDVETARAQGELPVPQHVIDDTIARNQRQIAATLADLIMAVKRALQSASSTQKATYILKGSAFWDVFGLFGPSARRLNNVLDEGLSVVQAALQLEDGHSQQVESQGASEESQDYGDLAALQEFVSSGSVVQSQVESAQNLHDPVNQLLSNLFGADAVADDALLTRTVDTWIQLAQRRVRSGDASWATYVNGYTSSSWSQLRDTAQRRKFTPYFLARIVDIGEPPVMDMLGEWLESLVQREAMLKFERILTSKILNKWHSHPLLWNPPFARTSGDSFEISLLDLRQRRIQLISTMLANMRHLLDLMQHDSRQTRSEYTVLLRRMMAAMRKSFQESDRSENAEVADDQIQGSYVAFVQQVVSLMQQYTAGICPVDAFFTDSSAFPLPVSDPQYVVGRLKWFSPKLGEAAARKQLVMVVKSLGERAAAEQQQRYWADQLVQAMSVDGQPSNCDAHKLQHVLMTAVLPIYILEALTTPCLWIMSRPVLYAYGRSIEKLLYQINFQDQASVQIAVDVVATFFRSATIAASDALSPTSRLAPAHIQTTLSSLLEAARRCLTVAQRLCQMHSEKGELRQLLEVFTKYARAVEAALTVDDSDLATSTISNETVSTTIQCQWQDTLDFSRAHLARKLDDEWFEADGKYYVRRRGTADEVMVSFDGQERVDLLAAIRSFRESYSRVFHGKAKRRHAPLDVIV